MINFRKIEINDKTLYNEKLHAKNTRSCQYGFSNLFMWGVQEIAFLYDHIVLYSRFDCHCFYPFPIGSSDKKAVLDAIFTDAKERGVCPCLTGVHEEDRKTLETLYPNQFYFHADRSNYDYVYDINDLADLRGRKFQKKRNHFNRFRAEHPGYEVVPLNACNLGLARHLVDQWYYTRMKADPGGDYLLENIAMARAFQNFTGLGMEGILVLDYGEPLAVTMGSRLSENTFDIHFEKAREDVDGAYNAVNCEFARYLRLKYPDVQFLDREDDMGLEGLRKAKLSYNPHHLIEKHWAYVAEDIYGD